MHTRLAATVLTLLIAASTGGAVRGAGGFGQPDPDHLVPIDESRNRFSNEYHHRAERLLRAPGWAEAVVICRPSFDPEECVAIHRMRDDPSRYVMVHTRASRNIWSARSDRNPNRRHVTVSRREVPLPTELGRRICRLWDRMLSETRSPVGGSGLRAMDGTTYEFHRHYLRGETYDPPDGEDPRRLTTLADALLAYGGAGYTKRPEKLKAVEKACRDLEDYLAKRPPLVRPKPRPRPRPVPAMPAAGPGGLSGLVPIPTRVVRSS